MPRGGTRAGAGRPPKRADGDLVEAIATSLVEMAIGQSSVQLELDSKGQVKPTVHVYHRDTTKAGAIAEAEFDRLMDKYHPKPKVDPPSSVDQFSDADLALLGLQRVTKAP